MSNSRRKGALLKHHRGKARLSERAVGVCPDPHVSVSLSSTRRAQRDAPYP
jgi:hypothetical protein